MHPKNRSERRAVRQKVIARRLFIRKQNNSLMSIPEIHESEWTMKRYVKWLWWEVYTDEEKLVKKIEATLDGVKFEEPQDLWHEVPGRYAKFNLSKKCRRHECCQIKKNPKEIKYRRRELDNKLRDGIIDYEEIGCEAHKDEQLALNQ